MTLPARIGERVGDTIGGFRIIRELGHSDLGPAYEAVDATRAVRRVIKFVSSSLESSAARQHIHREMLSAHLVHHPGLVQLHGYGQLADGQFYMVSEFLAGELLTSLLQHGPLPLTTALSISRQVADAMAMVHMHGIVHRDLKPANLMLVADDAAPTGHRVKILDLGVSKVLPGSEASQQALKIHLGTPSYMAPERLRGDKPDAPSDVYSLGIVLFEMLSGQYPFNAKNMLEQFNSHLHQPPISLKSLIPLIPQSVDSLIASMLLKNPLQRPSMLEVVQRLDCIINSRASLTPGIALRTDRPRVPHIPSSLLQRAIEPILIAMALSPFLIIILWVATHFWRYKYQGNSDMHESRLDMSHDGIHSVVDGSSMSAVPDSGAGPIEPAYDATRLMTGWFAVDNPHEMTVGIAQDFFVRMSADERGFQEINKNAALQKLKTSSVYDGGVVEPVRFGQFMKLELRPDAQDDFNVEPLATAIQPVVPGELTEWSWKVLPRRPGTHQQLRVIATSILKTSSDTIPKDFPVKTVVVRVHVQQEPGRPTPWLHIGLGIISTLLGALGLGTWVRRVRVPLDKRTIQAEVTNRSTILLSFDELRGILLETIITDADMDALLLDFFPKARCHCTPHMPIFEKINKLFIFYPTSEIVTSVRERYPSAFDTPPKASTPFGKNADK